MIEKVFRIDDDAINKIHFIILVYMYNPLTVLDYHFWEVYIIFNRFQPNYYQRECFLPEMEEKWVGQFFFFFSIIYSKVIALNNGMLLLK